MCNSVGCGQPPAVRAHPKLKMTALRLNAPNTCDRINGAMVRQVERQEKTRSFCWLRPVQLRQFRKLAPSAVLVLGLSALLSAVPPPSPSKALPQDLAGRAVNPFMGRQWSAAVFIFIATTCPISQRYSPEIQRLEAEFEPRGVIFWLVDPDATDMPSAIRTFLRAYGYSSASRVLRDPAHVLVRQTGAQVTPEVAVYEPGGRLAYRGRIDNWYVRLGWARRAPTTHDLEAALSDVLAGKPVKPRFTPVVGCFISDMQQKQ
jgi:hypothetical protein